MDNDNMKNITTAEGNPVSSDTASITSNVPGEVLLQDVFMLDKQAHFNRERIPERVVHAKGAGAYGYFEVTKDITKYTRADFLNKIGKRTEVFTRFSVVSASLGDADTIRDPRGFAVKFYTNEGNLDLVGNNTPVFFIRDAIQFPDLIHSQKRNPVTNVKDWNAYWDFVSLVPESVHQITIVWSDRGTPAGYGNMDGFATNTFSLYTDDTHYVYAKFHFKTESGIKNFTDKEATLVGGTNPDYLTQELYYRISKKDFPSWKVYVQIMKSEDADKYRFDPFDTTKVWYHKDYPLIEIGKMVLNRVPESFFNETEQSAFCPGNMVPGIGPSPDIMLQTRMISYKDAHKYRLGVNNHMIPVNMPKNAKVKNYQQDGNMNISKGVGPINYYPNSMQQNVTTSSTYNLPKRPIQGTTARHHFKLTPLDFEQARELYVRVMTPTDRDHLISNIAGKLCKALPKVRYRQTALFYLVDKDYGTRVAKALELDLNKVIELANMSNEDRIKATLN